MKCMTAPVLAFADFEKPFHLETDASADGLGAVLSQKQSDGKYHPVAYASRSLKGSESKYHSSKLEFLALKWAVVNQFREYLQYKPFQVKTDNNPLTYVMTSPNLDATGHRWVAALANFNMSLEYQKGSDNKVADCLSRITERLNERSVKALIERAKAGGEGVWAEADDPRLVCKDEELDEDVILQTKALIAWKVVFKNVADEHWVRAQKDDPVLRHVRNWMTRPKENMQTLLEYLTGRVPDADRLAYCRRQKNFVMKRDLLYVETFAPGTRDLLFAFVVPSKKCQAVLDGCHREAGHQGRDRTLSLLRERFWWPGMAVQAVLSVKDCARCHCYKARYKLPEMVTIGATEPMDLVHIDFIGMETTISTRKKPMVKTVLVVIDHFTRFVRAFVVDNRQAETVAKTLYDQYFSVFGFPRRLMSDNAPEFVGKVLTALCDILNVKQLRTSAYHPQTNGSVEHAHQMLIRMVGKLDPKCKHRWPDHILSICHSYNATRSQVTGYSPHFLMFRRRPRLPIDLLFPTVRRDAVKGVNEYVSALYEHLKRATSLARATADKEAQRFKRIYDRRAGAATLHPGDKVLTKLDAFIGARRKLKNRWHSQIHTVVRRVADGVPTYVVRNDSNGNEGVFHRERLLLWIAADADGNDGVRSNLAITVQVADGLVEGNMNDEKAVLLEGELRPELGHVQDDVRLPPP